MLTPKVKKILLVELSLILGAAVVFLTLVPERPAFINMSLASLAVLWVTGTQHFTRHSVWARVPVNGVLPDRARSGWRAAGVFTVLGLVVIAVLGDYDTHVWRPPAAGIPVAVIVYILWGLLQQYLFQYYLLGRLLVLLPHTLAIGLTGITYALVHVHDAGILLATVPTGIIWAVLYYRYRTLLPLAISHGVLAVAFNYWVYGQDLLAHWTSISM